MNEHRTRDARRRHARKADPKPEPPPVEPITYIASCLVGGCNWTHPAGKGALEAVEEHRRECHLWVKPGRLHRLEAA